MIPKTTASPAITDEVTEFCRRHRVCPEGTKELVAMMSGAIVLSFEMGRLVQARIDLDPGVPIHRAIDDAAAEMERLRREEEDHGN